MMAIGFLGISVTKVWFEALRRGLLLKNCLTQVMTVCFSTGHRVLKKPALKPSGPKDLPEWKEKRIVLNLSSEGC